MTGTVKKNNRIAEGIFEMLIETEACKNFIPGQFINVYLDDKSKLLPRPISISEGSENSVTIIYKIAGKGTEYLSAYQESQPIKISEPLGNGYDLKEDYAGKSVALVAGGIGIPPMVGLAKILQSRKANVDVFLGYQSEVFITSKFEGNSRNVFISTDDGSVGFHGSVVEKLKADGRIYDEYFACGPKGMLKSLNEYTAKIEYNVQMSVEERMGCGYGACFGCSCKIKEDDKIVRKRVCKHGPVFSGKELVWE